MTLTGSKARELASQVAPDPNSVIGGEALGSVPIERCRARPREGLGRLRRPVAAGRDERIAVSHVQLQSLRASGRLRFDFLSFRQRRADPIESQPLAALTQAV